MLQSDSKIITNDDNFTTRVLPECIYQSKSDSKAIKRQCQEQQLILCTNHIGYKFKNIR